VATAHDRPGHRDGAARHGSGPTPRARSHAPAHGVPHPAGRERPWQPGAARTAAWHRWKTATAANDARSRPVGSRRTASATLSRTATDRTVPPGSTGQSDGAGALAGDSSHGRQAVLAGAVSGLLENDRAPPIGPTPNKVPHARAPWQVPPTRFRAPRPRPASLDPGVVRDAEARLLETERIPTANAAPGGMRALMPCAVRASARPGDRGARRATRPGP
jgi:hypothetical protein